jgi:hypothetical protein
VDALSRALEQGRIPPELRERLLRLVQMVVERSDVATLEPILRGYIDALKPKSSEQRAAETKAIQLDKTNRGGDVDRGIGVGEDPPIAESPGLRPD